MRRAHFKVNGRFDGKSEATVTITVGTSAYDTLITVRPLHRHTTYTIPLSTVAEIVHDRCILAEAARKREERKVSR